ncbi:MAG: SDR family NAD(P)-dependent oxidoreductase [Gluconacetobacter diazotrophicus]|nr:SDR family NAD(P)-dependent oxidoreductase [Gluconacetobacter diazotrophicus]
MPDTTDRRIAVVTGGSAGIGLATAEALCCAGWSVAILARDPVRLEEAAALLRRGAAPGAAILPVAADVADPAAVDEAADRIERELGPIAAWVNNAMSTVVAPADRITAAEYARVTATTYLSQVHGTLAALRHMKPRRRGAIIQVSSTLGIRAAPLQAAYCGAKFAVSGFTDSLRAELAGDRLSGITLSVVYLPAVNTPQFGWSRTRTGRDQVAPDPVFDPRLCARAIVGAIRDPQREIWVGRSTAMAAIGQTLAPALLDSRVSSMREQQLGDPIPDRDGNLFEPVPGPAAIDGAATDRVSGTTLEIFTSRQRDLLRLGAVGAIGLAGTLGGLALGRRLPRLPFLP